MKLSLIFFVLVLVSSFFTLVSCQRSEDSPRVTAAHFDPETKKMTAQVQDPQSGEETSLAGVVNDQGQGSLVSAKSDSTLAAEATCAEATNCEKFVLDVYQRKGNDLLHHQFATENLVSSQGANVIPVPLSIDEGEFVGRPLSTAGARALAVTPPVPPPTDDEEKQLGPWLDLKGGGIAMGPPQTVNIKNPDGTVTPLYGTLENGSLLPAKGTAFKRIESPQDSWATGFMLSLLDGASAEFAKTYVPGNILAIGGIAHQFGGYNPPHLSHQNGMDADIPFVGNKDFDSVLDKNRQVTSKLNPQNNWQFWRLLLSQKIVEQGKVRSIVSMLLVSPEIKTFLCGWAKQNNLMNNPIDSEILMRLRPTDGHDDHFHLRVRCSPHHPLCRREGDYFQGTGCPP